MQIFFRENHLNSVTKTELSSINEENISSTNEVLCALVCRVCVCVKECLQEPAI